MHRCIHQSTEKSNKKETTTMLHLTRTMRLLPAALFAAAALPASAVNGPVIAIDGGKVSGAVEAGVVSWKGIPYAAPPVGPLRWHAPQAAAPWRGVRRATRYGSDCMQLPFPSDAAPMGTVPAEDCLYLNVWKPAGAQDKLPVIVWIYGGGFVNGGSSPATYSGAPIARRGVMLVSFNYRVGRFGFFAHPALARDGAQGSPSTNFGYLDQIAALKWVKRNIAAFGGDPSNVTIMGESAGGISVNTLLTSPLARGLFSKAVIQSGGEGVIPGPPPGVPDASQSSIDFGVKHGIPPDDPEALRKLRALTAEQVVDGFNLETMFTGRARTQVGPVIDGVVSLDPLREYQAGRFAKVPVMIGATDDDIGGRTGFMVSGARRIAGLLADQGVPVYHYRFSYVSKAVEWPGGAKHASELPYFFDTVDAKYGARADARDTAVGRTVSAYLVSFARTGNPNTAGLLQWPRYERAKDELLEFTASGEAVAEKDPLGKEIDAAQGAALPAP
jgi:para-nitrobenzyl esterase